MTSPLPSDELLARRAAAGDREAFAGLVAAHAAGLAAVVLRRVGDRHAAEDLCQEIWIKVYRALPSLSRPGSVRSWLYAIALNHVRDIARRRTIPGTPGELPDPEAVAHGRDPAGRLADRALIATALARVPETHRVPLELVAVQGLSYEEVAAVLGLRPGTVKSRVSRGRRAFAGHYAALCGDPPGVMGASS